MGAQGIVVQPGQGPVLNFTPGRSIVLKLLGGESWAERPATVS